MQAIKITDGRTSLWQWDTGVRIKVYGCTDVDQMHFVTPGGIISRELVNNECDVPDTALRTDGLLKMYAFDRTETGGVTRCDFLLAVKARPKPADYIDPPDEYDNLQALAERVAPLIPGSGGSVTPEQIGAAVDDYLTENPVQVEESDPTVPDWAKAEQKPSYTAEEVGALPADTEIPESYTLPVASADTLGGVKVGEGLQMTGDVLGVVDASYELISLVEIDEPVAQVRLDGFKLKEFLLTVYTPGGDTTATLAGTVYTEGGDSLYFGIGSGLVANAGRYTKVHGSIENNLLCLRSGQPAIKITDSTSSGVTGYVVTSGYINKVQPYLGSSQKFPEGSWLKLEGVRANA